MTTILFDVDGVFLSEARCFDVSALTVEELLYSPRYLNLDGRKFKTTYTDEEISEIRQTIFLNDEILERFKALGLNSNWDMLFISFSLIYIDILKEEGLNLQDVDITNLNSVGDMLGEVTVRPELVKEFLNDKAKVKEDIYPALLEEAKSLSGLDDLKIFELYGPIWSLGHQVYQEWYLGSELVEADTGMPAEELDKEGFIYDEEWIVAPSDIKKMLNELKERGYTIGVATGRPRQETLIPFEQVGLDKVFDEERISTATEVMWTQGKNLVDHALTKPHPFSYLWSLYEHNDRLLKSAAHGQNVSEEKVFIVGDSIADYYCAKAIDATFLAPLTGLTGTEVKDTFIELGVNEECLLKDVLEVPEALNKLD